MWDEIRDWMTAIGTVGAVIVALWLARRDERRRKADNEALAGLCAASIVSQLSQARVVVSSMTAQCIFKNLNLSQATSDWEVVKKLNFHFKNEIFEPDRGTLLGLVGLKANAANRIARAFDLFHLVRRQVIGVVHTDAAVSDAVLRGMVESWGSALMEAVDLLDVAIAECVKASKVAAPTPTPDERYVGEEQ